MLPKQPTIVLLSLITSLGTFARTAHAEDWARFLGPSGKLTATATANTPTEWDKQNNTKWSTRLPGKGVSSPIIVGDAVIVTCYSGYGTGKEGEVIEDLRRHVVCADKATGAIRWQKEIDVVLPEDPYTGIGVPAHGYASHTPVSDGKLVYVFLGKPGVFAFDLDGNQVWQTSVGTNSGPKRWGSSASPILHNGLLIVTASEESETLYGIDTQNGEIKWRQEASSLANTWSTPVLVTSDQGRVDLVVNVPGEVWGINPETGKLRWHSRGTTDTSTAASLTPGDGVVYATGGRQGDAVAVKVGGKGDVNDSHVLWDVKIPGRFATPVLHEGHLFCFAGGVLSTYAADSGEKVHQLRLGNSPGRGRGRDRAGMFKMDYASPVLIGEHLYLTTRAGQVFVVTAKPKPELVATNSFEADEGFGGTPAVSDGELYIRSDTQLYCLSAK